MEDSGATKYLRERVIDAGLCTNCGACVNSCPYYTSYNDRIVVLDECTLTDGECVDICPAMPTDAAALNRLLFDEKDMTSEAGAVKALYITRAADERVRKNAQHGGTVTALVELALAEGLIDAAVLSGAGDPMLPEGVAITRAHQARQSSRSRFVVTPNVAAFNAAAVGEARSIGIVATPCQALALAKMRNSRKERIRKRSGKIRLVIGLFCGWALSSAALKSLLAEHVALDSIIGMDIPPSKYHSLEVYTTNGTVGISLDEVERCVRPACRVCSDMTAEYGDVSVGSARLPEGWDEAKSWNQLIVRTKAGQELIDLARSRGALVFRDVPEGTLDNLKKASSAKKRKGAEKA